MVYWIVGIIISMLMLILIPSIFFIIGLAGIYPTYKLFLERALFQGGEEVVEHFSDSMTMVKVVWSFISVLFWPTFVLCMATPGGTDSFVSGMAEGFREGVDRD